MPLLSDLTGSGGDPTLTQVIPNTAQVEPLGGPSSVDDVMDRFPEEVYNQSRDTHLYRFLSALCGDSGAGLLKRQTYIARLLWEAEFLNFDTLDAYYTSYFKFRRLKSETYTTSPSDALTPLQWDAMLFADEQYKHRITDFFKATRLGNSPAGLAYAARSGSGLESDIIEHYKYIYDQYSDDKLFLGPYGRTASTSEYVVSPRILSSGLGGGATSYLKPISSGTVFTPPVLNTAARPVKTTTPLLATIVNVLPTAAYQLMPEIERNVINILDRLAPATTVATIALDEGRYNVVAADPQPFASSSRIHVNRFVVGASGVPWPGVDTTKNYFIQAGQEKEAAYFFGRTREYPVVFHTVESVHGYTDQALNDPAYNSANFYNGSISPFEKYRSEQIGAFGRLLTSIYTFLQNLPTDNTFAAEKALAIQNTPMVLEGSGVVG